MRYPYLAFGMIVWRMRPCQVEFKYLNIWQYLGYDYVDEEVLFNAYKAAVSLDIGVRGVLDYGYLTTLLENDESIWRLKEALNSGLNWKDVQNNNLFKDVTQRYGYDQLHVLPATEGGADEVALNLEETYNTVFDENPVKLHLACEAHNLHIYVPQVWLRIKGFALDSGTRWILKAADEQNVNDETALEKRYPYFVFGKTLWDVKPWLDGDARYEVLDNFGYAAAEYFEDMGLFKSYATLFERYIASGLTTRERQFKNRDTFLQKVAENLRGSDHTSIEFSLYRNLASFLGNVPNNQKESVWRLAHACSSGMDWDAMLQRPRFKGVAQTFGFDQLPLLTFSKDEPDFVKKAGKDLQDAYIEAFERSPIELLSSKAHGIAGIRTKGGGNRPMHKQQA
ncbi:hypothetical protein DPV78_011569 [Talaromyces pinophilus]|nr:hypothetical protein DPV78_011569 [Talaromyces pinophilus]